MKRVQIFLSVNAAKWLIAEAISRRPEVQTALENGTLILKGGTTTSCLSAILTGSHLRLCGRVTCRGAVANLKESSNPHTVLLSRQGIRSLDGLERDAFLKFGPECVLVTGANLIDCSGGAALLAGSPGGGSYGAALSAIETEGIRVLIAAGTEKLTSGNISSAVVVSQKTCLSLPWDGLRTASISWRSDYGVGCHLYAGACEISPDWKRRHSRSGRRFSHSSMGGGQRCRRHLDAGGTVLYPPAGWM